MSIIKVNEIFYFRIPLNNIPFNEFPFHLGHKYAYCRFYNTSGITREQPGFNVVGIYNYFTADPLNDYTKLLESEWLFGEVLSYDPPLRKEGKWEIIGRQPIDTANIIFPHFKSGKEDLWFYIKDGIYHIFTGIKSTKEKVGHLERAYLYGQNAVKLRIVVELLRSEAKLKGGKLSLKEWEDIAFKVFRSESVNAKSPDEELRQAVASLLPDMLDQPIYKELPQHIRGRAIN